MSHAHLVRLALKALDEACCALRFPELRPGRSGERPDAVGWMASGLCIVIECKTTRKDFRDEWARRKDFRRSGGVGARRFYLSWAGILDKDEVASTGWGLVEVYPGGRFAVALKSSEFTSDKDAEVGLLIRAFSKKPDAETQLKLPL